MFGAHRISTFIDCYQSCVVAVSFTKDLSRVSILSSTSCLNTGIENDLLTMQDYKPMVLFCSPRGHFQSLSYLHEAVFVLALSVLCSVFLRSFCLFWWTVELQHFMVSDISELCLISVCWHIIIMLVAEEAAGCTSWLWSHRVQRHGFSSAQNWVGGVCQTSGWSRLENTEELQPATAAKAISNSRKVLFFFCFWAPLLYCEQKLKWW